MKYTISRFDTVHELIFGKPIFGFIERPSHVLRIFYETISPRFPIAADHLAIFPSNVLSEVQIRIGLFNNAAPLELRSEKMTIRFPNVGQAEVALIKDATILAHEALSKALLPDIVSGTSKITEFFWLKIEGGTEGVRLLFDKLATPSKPIEAKTFGADTSTHHVKVGLQNTADKWDISITSEPSLVPGSDLFVLLSTSFQPGTPLAPIQQQIEFVESTNSKLWSSLGLEAGAL